MFDMVGLSEFAKQISDLYGSVDDISKELLESAAPPIKVLLWKKAIKQNVMKNGTPCTWWRVLRSGHLQQIKYKSRSTGEMYNSVSYDVKKTLADIYPKGYDNQKKPVRNATKAYVLNYGRGKTSTSKFYGGYEGTHFVDGENGITDNVVDVAVPAMQTKFNRILKRKGLI